MVSLPLLPSWFLGLDQNVLLKLGDMYQVHLFWTSSVWISLGLWGGTLLPQCTVSLMTSVVYCKSPPHKIHFPLYTLKVWGGVQWSCDRCSDTCFNDSSRNLDMWDPLSLSIAVKTPHLVLITWVHFSIKKHFGCFLPPPNLLDIKILLPWISLKNILVHKCRHFFWLNYTPWSFTCLPHLEI